MLTLSRVAATVRGLTRVCRADWWPAPWWPAPWWPAPWWPAPCWLDLGWVLIGLLGVQVAGYVAWLAFAAPTPDERLVVSDVAVLPVGLLAAVLAWRASRQPALDRRSRLAWSRLALGLGAFWLGDLSWCILEVLFEIDPFPSIADVGYLSFYPLVLWGLLTFPLALRTPGERLKFWIDALTVVVGGGSAIWYFVFVPVLHAAPGDPLSTAVALAYPVGDLLLLLGLATLLLRRPGGGTAGALRILAAGLMLLVLSDGAFGPLALQDAYEAGSWVDVVWILAGLLFATGAQYQCWRAARSATPLVPAEPVGRLYSLLPYGAVLLGQGLLLFATVQSATHTLVGLAAGSIAVTGLVVMRQIVAVRENARLLAAQATRRQTLLELAHGFSAQVAPDELHSELVQAAATLLDGDDARITRWEPSVEQLVAVRSFRDPPGPASDLLDRACAEAAARRAAYVSPTPGDLRGAPDRASSDGGLDPLNGPGAAGWSVVAVPVAHDGRLFGTLAVARAASHGPVTADDAEILGLLAGLAAATIVGSERAQLQGALLAARTAEHELNNQLATAAGFAELLAIDDALPEHLRPLADDALNGALEAARLVGEIRKLRRLVLAEGAVPDGNVIDLKHSAA